MSADRLHRLAERLSTLFRASLRRTASDHGLKLVQLEALIYFSLANRYSDTPAALTDYLGVTKGTVSQTLSALQRHGLITKNADPDDGRITRIALTPEGEAIGAAAYPTPLLRDSDNASSEAVADALQHTLRALQQGNDFKMFGQCRDCRYFGARARGGHCGLTGESLTRLETTKICREYEG